MIFKWFDYQLQKETRAERAFPQKVQSPRCKHSLSLRIIMKLQSILVSAQKITNSLDWCYPKITFRLVSETSSYEIWSKSTHFPSTDFSQRSREHIVKEWSFEWRRCWTWLSICRRMKLTLIFHHTQKTTQNELKT